MELLRDPIWQSIGALIALIGLAPLVIKSARWVRRRRQREQRDSHTDDYPNYMALPPPQLPKEFLRESPEEIVQKIADVHPLDREAVTDALFRGRWVRGRGRVSDIRETGGCYAVFIDSDKGGGVVLTFPPTMRPAVKALRNGDHVSFEGQVYQVTSVYVDFVRPTIDQMPGSPRSARRASSRTGRRLRF